MAKQLVVLILLHILFQTDVPVESFEVAKPSAVQVKWLHYEIGAVIHFNMQTFNKTMKQGDVAPPNTFNPSDLSVDQWVNAAVSFGAKWVTLTLSHASGFLLWPSKTYNYTVRNSSWRNGTGDIALDLINSCRKHGVEYGYFYSVNNNYFMDVKGFRPRNASELPRYRKIVIQQFNELLGPTSKYRNPFFLWLDSGVEKGVSPNIGPIIDKFAKSTVCDVCPTFHIGSSLRWVGNEQAVAPLPNWYAVKDATKCGVNRDGSEPGDPHGRQFCPSSCDTVVREHYWFWHNNTEKDLKTPRRLIQDYLTSVGRGCPLILDLNPDPRGLIPDPDVKVYQAMGEGIKLLYKEPVMVDKDVELHPYTAKTYKHARIRKVVNGSIVLREDIANNGQLVEEYAIYIILWSGEVVRLDGSTIGNKRIHPFPPEVSEKDIVGLEIMITKLVVGNKVMLREVAVYDWREAARRGFVRSQGSDVSPTTQSVVV